MRNALEDPTVDDSCLEFFGLEQLPFACLPETQPIFHAEQYALLEKHIAELMNETDRLFVLRGADGSGKTTLLKRFLGGLENASIALIDETCSDGTDFYCTFLRQMGFQDITGKLRELRTITREFLVHRATASDHVLLVLDNAPRIRPAVLEQLRWISGIQRQRRRVLSVVIAGNSGLDRILESPAMSGLRYESNVNFTIRAFTNEETAAYIRHRLEISGCADAIQFTAEACDLVHRHSGGLPKSIDRIGSLLLAEAARRQTRTVDDALVRDIAQAENLPVNVVPLTTRGRRKTDADHEAGSDQVADDNHVADDDQVTDAAQVADAGQEAENDNVAGTDHEADTDHAADADHVSESPDVELEELLDRVEQLSARVSELENEKTEADELVKSLETQTAELRESLTAREQEAEELAQGVRDRDEEIKDRSEEIRDRDIEIRDRDLEIRQLRERLDDSKAALQESANEARELADRCNEAETTASSARSEADRAQRRVDKLERSKAHLQERTRGLRGELRDAKKTVRQLSNAEADLEKSEAQRNELLESVSRLEELESELAAKNATIEDLRDRLADLEKSEAERNELLESVSRLEELQKELATKNATIEELRDRLAGLDNDRTQVWKALPENMGELDDQESDEDIPPIVAFDIIRGGKIEWVLDATTAKPRMMIGRDEDSDLRLESDFVSRHHALLFCSPWECHIEDLNSFNGTLINGKAVTRCRLKPNQLLVIGDFILRPRAAQG